MGGERLNNDAPVAGSDPIREPAVPRMERPQEEALPHGVYYEAPDSAHPFPPGFWTPVDEADVEKLTTILESANGDEAEARYNKHRFLSPQMFRLADTERRFLRQLGDAGTKLAAHIEGHTD